MGVVAAFDAGEWFARNSSNLQTWGILVSAAAGVTLVIVVLWQLRLARDEIVLDHSRRRAQVTLEYYRTVMDAKETARAALTDAYGSDPISESTAEVLHKAAQEPGGEQGDIAKGRAIRSYLNGLERLAVGSNTGVLDEEVLKRLARYRFVNARRQFLHYIERSQARASKKKVYSEFSELATKWDGSEEDTPGDTGRLPNP